MVHISSGGYGSTHLEEGVGRRKGSRMTLRIAGAVGLLCVGVVALGVTVGRGRAGSAASELLVAKPAHDFTASRDKSSYNAYFSQLSSSESQKHAKYLARDAAARTSAAAAMADLGSYFHKVEDSISGEMKKDAKKVVVSSLSSVSPAAKEEVKGKGKSEGVPPEVAAEAGVAASVYKSADAARSDIDSFFDSMPTGKKVKHLTAADADKELMGMFGDDGHDHSAHHATDKQVSAAKAQDDLDSYFDSMPTTSKRARASSPKVETGDLGLDADEPSSSHSAHWSSQSSEVRKYIDGKRNAMKKGGAFSAVTMDGSVVKQSKIWSSDNARKEMDGYWSAMGGGDRRAEEARAKKDGDVKAFARLHPGYKRAIEQAHTDWAAAHGGRPPQTEAEKKEYAKLVETEDIHRDDPQHIVIEAYLKEHPEVAAKFKKVHDTWYAKYATPPHSDAEKQEYKDLMIKYVGHLDIDAKKVMAKQDKGHKAEKHTGSKAALLKEYMRSHPEVQTQIDRVHAEWKKGHTAPPKGTAEKVGRECPSPPPAPGPRHHHAEARAPSRPPSADTMAQAAYDALMKKYVGDLHITTAAKGRGLVSLAKVGPPHMTQCAGPPHMTQCAVCFDALVVCLVGRQRPCLKRGRVPRAAVPWRFEAARTPGGWSSSLIVIS